MKWPAHFCCRLQFSLWLPLFLHRAGDWWCPSALS